MIAEIHRILNAKSSLSSNSSVCSVIFQREKLCWSNRATATIVRKHRSKAKKKISLGNPVWGKLRVLQDSCKIMQYFLQKNVCILRRIFPNKKFFQVSCKKCIAWKDLGRNVLTSRILARIILTCKNLARTSFLPNLAKLLQEMHLYFLSTREFYGKKCFYEKLINGTNFEGDVGNRL